MYNDDLDEDNSDYVEEGEGDDDDDIDSDEDEANESATGQPQEPAAGLLNQLIIFVSLFWCDVWSSIGPGYEPMNARIPIRLSAEPTFSYESRLVHAAFVPF